MATANDYVSRCLLQSWRAGHLPSASEAKGLVSLFSMKPLRALISSDDLNWLLPEVRSGDEYRAALCIGLLAGHTRRPDVQQELQAAWDSASPFVKSQLLWRITDDPRLPMKWRESLFAFVVAEWDVFHVAAREFYGVREELVLAWALERYASGEFPVSKGWAYLCNIASVTIYPAAAKAVLGMGLGSPDDFTRFVAQWLLDNFETLPRSVELS